VSKSFPSEDSVPQILSWEILLNDIYDKEGDIIGLNENEDALIIKIERLHSIFP
jgi:hypothetical protein